MRRLIVSLALLATPAIVTAQGSVGVQGFGYPAGGLSAHAAASGGAFAEFDYASTRNPSALLGWGRGGMYFSYAPEFRALRAGGQTEKSTTARFPGAVAAFQMGSRAVGALSWSTLLDRTWETIVRDQQVLGVDTVAYTERVQSTGAINDLRLGVTYSVTTNVAVGLGLHGYTGENRLTLRRQFDDSLAYGTLARQLTLGYLGNAVSLGATWRVRPNLAVAASARAGGALDLRVADTLIASGKVPSRYGLAVRYDGLPGASVAFAMERVEWSSMRDLSTSSLGVHDTWEYALGAEVAGPRMRGTPSLVSLGYRQRDLPFSVVGGAPRERIFSSGWGIPLAGPRAVLDLALQRATRGPVSSVKETAWILSVGATIRP